MRLDSRPARSVETEAKTKNRLDAVYVGMARTGARARLRHHLKNKTDWTHFSLFDVWQNVRDTEIEELEGCLRHIYRKDSPANRLNVQWKSCVTFENRILGVATQETQDTCGAFRGRC